MQNLYHICLYVLLAISPALGGQGQLGGSLFHYEDMALSNKYSEKMNALTTPTVASVSMVVGLSAGV